MLHFYLVSVAFILCTKTVQGASLTQDIMPEQTFMCSDENFNRIARENDALKATIENLKIRLELQQVSCEQKLMKMQISINETKNFASPQALQELQKALVEPILAKVDGLIKIEESLLKNILQNRNDELNQIYTKLESLSNHTMEGISINERQIQTSSNCVEAQKKTQQNGIHNITLRNYGIPFPVYCEENEFGGGWTVIQRRKDGSVDFYRNWSDYKNGFGNLSGEFFIGLDKLHALTSESPQELLIELEDFENNSRYAKYDAFGIGSEDESFALLILGNYSGNAGDSLSFHKNMKFSTKDQDNDTWSTGDCANDTKGAWWFKACQYSHLNGVYSKNSKVEFEQGINWHHWKGDLYSLKSARMLIRNKNA